MENATTQPLVSVIIPTYNRPLLLRETIDSVLAQTYPRVEVLVVDDGSTDDTPALLEGYGDRIVNIRKVNAGGTAARNTGLAAAKGDFLNFVDHDDLFLPDKIERQMQLLEGSPDLGWAHCGFWRMEKDGRYIDKVTTFPHGDARMTLPLGCFIWSGAPLIRRAVLDDVGSFNEAAWSSDAEMWLRIALAGHQLGCVAQPLGAYRIMPDSTMADVARTERMDMPTYERVFTDPRLPEEARALKPYAYFNQRFWLACRYFAVGQWDDARRNLDEAFAWTPEARTDRRRLFHLFLSNALDPRVSDATAFIESILTHGPGDVVAILSESRGALKCWACVGLALRCYGRGEIAFGQAELRRALEFEPALASSGEEFARTVADFALRLPVQPLEYVDAVLGHLPPELSAFASLRGRVRGEVALISAFQDYEDGRHDDVPRKVLAAVRQRPSLLSNRGVGAIFVKSMLRGRGEGSRT